MGIWPTASRKMSGSGGGSKRFRIPTIWLDEQIPQGFSKEWAVLAAVQGGSGYMPLGRLYIFPLGFSKKVWLRRRFRAVQGTYQLSGCANSPKLFQTMNGSGGNSERYVHIPPRCLDKPGHLSACVKLLKTAALRIALSRKCTCLCPGR